jgi:hypothetical protein
MDKIKQKVALVLELLAEISPDFRDDFAGAKGRVVSCWTGFKPVRINGMFSLTHAPGTAGMGVYALEFAIHTTPESTPLEIMQACTKVAELQARAPRFEAVDLNDIYEALLVLRGAVKA